MAKLPRKPRPELRATESGDDAARSAPLVPVPPDPRQPGLFERPLPQWVEPCLPTLVDQAPSGAEWCHEIKWDGFRVSAYIHNRRVTIKNRQGQDWTDRFISIATSLASLPVQSALLDGEVIALNEDGLSDFAVLERALASGELDATSLMAFDLLHLDDMDLRGWALDKRRQTLLDIVPATLANVRVSEDIEGDGAWIYWKACEHGLEGIVSKRRASAYQSGRSTDWVKIKCVRASSFLVIGYEPDGPGLGALRLAEEVEDGLRPAGRVSTGLTRTIAAALKRRLDPLIVSRPPLEEYNFDTVVWVRPAIRVEIAYRGRNTEGGLRHPSFKAIATD